MKFILPATLLLFSIAVLTSGLKPESVQQSEESDENVRSTVVVGSGKAPATR